MCSCVETNQPSCVDKIRAFFKPKELTPDERWKKESKHCRLANKVTNTAIHVIKATLVGVGIASLVVPAIAIAIGTGGLGIAIGAAVIAVAGVAAAILGFLKLEDVRKSLDFTDYSDKSTVIKDINRITQLPLQVLSEAPNSPVYRIKQLCKWGVIGSKSAARMQAIYKSYKDAHQLVQKYVYDHPHVQNIDNLTGPSVAAYKKAKERLDKANVEWVQFQQDVLKDVPKFG